MTLAPQGPFIHVFGWPLLLQSFLVLTFIHYNLVMRHRGFVTVGLADRKNMPEDVGLPKNAVLGRTYTQGYRQEPGDRTGAVEGLHSLDLRSLEDQANDPANTNRPERASFPMPFNKQ